jgi:hypothetical protein
MTTTPGKICTLLSPIYIEEIVSFRMLEHKSKWVALIPIILFVFLFFKPNVSGDGYGYYLNTAAFFEDFRPDVGGQLKICQYENSCPEIVQNPSGKYVVRWAFGFPLMSGPFFLAMLFLEKYIHVPFDDALVQKLGIPFFRNLALPLTTLLLFMLTLHILPGILRKMNAFAAGTEKSPNPYTLITMGVMSFPILFYVTYGPSYSHMAEAAMFALATYFFLKDKPFLTGVAIGLGIWTRYTAGAFILPFLVYYWFVKKNQSKAISFFGGVIPFLVVLALYFQVQFGTLFGSPYLREFILNPPTMLINIFRIFLDVDRGLLFWTPLFLVSIYGLWKWNDDRKYPLLGCIALNVLIYSGFNAWDAGWGLSNRYFSVFLVTYIMGLYALYSHPKWKIIIQAGVVYTFILFFLFLAAATTISNDIWFFTRLFKFYFMDGHILEWPGMVFDKIPLLRLARGEV